MTDPTAIPLQQALNAALDDELRARTIYRSVLETYGPVWPFVNIAQAEQRHIDALVPLFQRYGLPLPPDRWSGRIEPPPSVVQACRDGVAGEIGNYSMYDRLLRQVTQPDVRQVFANLRNASAYHHLPAFRSCAGAPAGFSPASSANAGSWLPFAAGAALGVGSWVWWRNAG